jgi:hypothetical protein
MSWEPAAVVEVILRVCVTNAQVTPTARLVGMIAVLLGEAEVLKSIIVETMPPSSAASTITRYSGMKLWAQTDCDNGISDIFLSWGYPGDVSWDG